MTEQITFYRNGTRHPVDTTQEAFSEMFEAAECDVIFKIGSLENDTYETQNGSIGVLEKLTLITVRSKCPYAGMYPD